MFAQSGFGLAGGDLLVSSENSGQIYRVDATGDVNLWATVPLGVNQLGLRQMAFAPAGFGAWGGDLFVSVSGSPRGGGTFGSVDVLNASGRLVAVLSQGTVGMPFDPRGLDFENSNTLLINDGDPSILAAPPAAFTAATPEPGGVGIAGAGLLLLGLLRLRWDKRKERRAPKRDWLTS